jgi:5-keto 4-deoxyuronate isomerase
MNTRRDRCYRRHSRASGNPAVPLSKEIGLSPELAKEFAVGAFLERRELGAINVGGRNRSSWTGECYAVGHREALYIGMGARYVRNEQAVISRSWSIRSGVGTRPPPSSAA